MFGCKVTKVRNLFLTVMYFQKTLYDYSSNDNTNVKEIRLFYIGVLLMDEKNWHLILKRSINNRPCCNEG